jgi:hypothetical protein
MRLAVACRSFSRQPEPVPQRRLRRMAHARFHMAALAKGDERQRSFKVAVPSWSYLGFGLETHPRSAKPLTELPREGLLLFRHSRQAGFRNAGFYARRHEKSPVAEDGLSASYGGPGEKRRKRRARTQCRPVAFVVQLQLCCLLLSTTRSRIKIVPFF